MSEENQDIVPEAEVPAAPAPEQETTATPESAETEQPETSEEAPKTFTQEELDAILAKRLAREERKWRREMEQRPEPMPIEPDDDGESDPYKIAEQIIAEREQQKQQRQLQEQYYEREESALEKYDDFQQVAYNPTLPVTDHMALAIQASDQGPDVLYWLGSNPKEAARISALHPVQQAREIGKIEARLEANPPARKTSSAPAPISPVTRPTGGAKAIDTTDPRSIGQMSTSEWIEAERQRQIRKLEAQRR